MILTLQWMLVNASVLLLAFFLAKYFAPIFRLDDSVFPLQKKMEDKVFALTGLYRGPMTAFMYLRSLLQFELLCFILMYFHARAQSFREAYFSPAEAFQLAASFITNTNWQNFPGEIAWGNPFWLMQVIFNNFQSAAIGLCVLIAFSRAFFRNKIEGIGNFWIDLWRAVFYVLMPIALISSLLLVSQGVPQNFRQNLVIQQYDTSTPTQQTIPMGPFAIHDAIKLLGTNGGSYTQANGASPIENPSGFSFYLGLVLMLLIPSMSCFLFGNLIGCRRLGWILWGMMFLMASVFLWNAYDFETPSMLAKETRLGTEGMVLWNTVMTATATGSIGGILDELQPLSNGAYLFLMNLGEIAFGGSGMGVINLLMVLILCALIMNLLTGSSATFLRKKIPLNVVKLSMLYIILSPCLILMTFFGFYAFGIIDQSHPYAVLAWWHAISSWVQNNGSGYYGFIQNVTWMNYFSGLLMLAGRFIPISFVLAMLGILKKERFLESHQESFSVDSLLFAVIALVVIFIITLLAFLPLWSFGPLAGQVLVQG
jgi:potassium-transporting ATPase potassium-binding subunit